jgi:hypothetical protein
MGSGERRAGASGESMPHDRSRGRQAGHWVGVHGLRRAAAGAALLTLAAALGAPAALAQTPGSGNDGVWGKFLRSVGVNTTPDPNSDINYTERPPLVVPPSRELPPPVAESPAPAAGWPTGTAKTVKHAKSKTDVDPATAVQTPNPPFQKKPWYNPAGWFSKEEYATFAGEPVRQDLTEPPAGYRIPSPEQPYGISPDKKATKPTAQDLMVSPVSQSASQPGK